MRRERSEKLRSAINKSVEELIPALRGNDFARQAKKLLSGRPKVRMTVIDFNTETDVASIRDVDIHVPLNMRTIK